MDDNSQTKNDRKDPKTIAKLVIGGRYFETYVATSVYAELRNIVKIYEHVIDCKSVVENKIIQWLDNYFPEFATVFGNWECKSAMITLKTFPLPVYDSRTWSNEGTRDMEKENQARCWKEEGTKAL